MACTTLSCDITIGVRDDAKGRGGGYGGENEGIIGILSRMQLLFLCFDGVADPVPRNVIVTSKGCGGGICGTDIGVEKEEEGNEEERDKEEVRIEEDVGRVEERTGRESYALILTAIPVRQSIVSVQTFSREIVEELGSAPNIE